jgi:SpoVK/Ycf46/Vps4 family AAA+-type ATPase
LNELDGISTTGKSSSEFVDNRIFVLAACKSLENLDKALLRPGRLHYHLALYPPNRDDVCEIFSYYLSKIPLEKDFSFQRVVSLYCARLGEDEYNPADISSVCRGAMQLALKENVAKIRSSPESDFEPVKLQYFEKLLPPTLPSHNHCHQPEFQFDTSKPFVFQPQISL